MRNLLYISLFLLLISSLFVSCEDEDKLRYDVEKIDKTFMPYISLAETSEPGFSPENLNAAQVTFTVDIRGQEQAELTYTPDNVASIDVFVTYDNVLEPLEVPLTGVVRTVPSWPEELTINLSDLIGAIDGLNSIDEIKIADVFNFRENINLKDGRVIEGLNDQQTIEVFDADGNELGPISFFSYHVDLRINESAYNKPDLNIYVNCPSDLAGTYTCVTTGAGGAAATGVVGEYTDTRTITVTEIGGGVYEFDEAFGGFYDFFYGPFYGGGPLPGRYIVLCGEVVADPSLNDPWGLVAGVEGSVDASGVITITWYNLFGTVFMEDPSLDDSATMVLTPQ